MGTRCSDDYERGAGSAVGSGAPNATPSPLSEPRSVGVTQRVHPGSRRARVGILLGLDAGDQQAVAPTPNRTLMAGPAICRQPPKVFEYHFAPPIFHFLGHRFLATGCPARCLTEAVCLEWPARPGSPNSLSSQACLTMSSADSGRSGRPPASPPPAVVTLRPPPTGHCADCRDRASSASVESQGSHPCICAPHCQPLGGHRGHRGHPCAFAPQEFGNLEVAARLVVGGVERSER